jgi:hypothetical protein
MLRVSERSARRPSAIVAIGTFVVVLVSGALLRIGTLRPRNVFATDTYNRLFSLHGAVTLAALPLFLLYFAPAAKRPAAKRDERWRAGAATSFVLGAVFVGSAAHEGDWMRSCGLVAMLAGTAAFAWAIVVPQLRSETGVFLAVAVGCHALAWGGELLGWRAASGTLMLPVVLVVLALPLFALRARGKDVGGSGFLAAVVVYAASWALARFWGGGGLAAIPELVAGGIIGVAVFRSAQHEDSRWVAWVRRVEASFFVAALLPVVLMQLVAGGVPLDDTLFAVGAAHLHAFVLVFALLRRLDGAPRSGLGWTGLAVATVGAHAFGWGCVVLGSRGMPRRYAGYLDQFEHLQVAASVGAFVMLAGLLATVTAHAAARAKARNAPGSQRA